MEQPDEDVSSVDSFELREMNREFDRKFKHVTRALISAVTHFILLIFFIKRLYAIEDYS